MALCPSVNLFFYFGDFPSVLDVLSDVILYIDLPHNESKELVVVHF